MNEAVQIGPFLVQWGLAAWICGGLAGYAAMRLRLKREPAGARSADTAFASGLLILLGWKFGSVVFDPQLLFRDPLKLMLAGGSQSGLAIGLAAAAVYAAAAVISRKIELRFFLDALPFGILTALAVKSLFGWKYGKITSLPWGIAVAEGGYRHHPINVYIFIVSASLLLVLWLNRKPLGRGFMLRDFLIYGGIGLLAVSCLDRQPIWFLYLSGMQWLNLAMIAAGLLTYTNPERGLVEMDKEQRGKDALNSPEQNAHASRNRSLNGGEEIGTTDNKKLNGPNRPST